MALSKQQKTKALRDLSQRQIERISVFINELTDDKANKIEIQTRLSRLEVLFEEFNQHQTKVELELEGDDLIRPEVEDLYFNTKSIGLSWIEKIGVKADIKQENDFEEVFKKFLEQSSKVGAGLRLPPIEVPVFDGNYKDWKGFQDLFNSLVHNNPKLTSVEKLQYLKKSLTGSAKGVLRNLNITEANYKEAYDELIQVYNKTDIIKESHFETIMEQPKLVTGTAEGLRSICNNFTESIRALKALDEPTEHWDSWLIFILSSKIDNESRKLWRRDSCSKSSTKAKFSDLIDFLNNRIYELTTATSSKTSNDTKNQTTSKKQQKFSNTATTSDKDTSKCLYCNSNEHFIFHCRDFLQATVQSRRIFIKQNGLCFNCMKKDHLIRNCSSSRTCKICNLKHNTLLHENQPNKSFGAQQSKGSQNQENQSQHLVTTNPKDPKSNEASCSHATISSNFKTTTDKFINILPTAVILVKNGFGNAYVKCRVLLDSGSQVSLISENCVQKLNLKRSRAKVEIFGVGSDTPNLSRGQAQLELKSRFNDFEISSNALIMKKISNNLPQSQCMEFSSMFSLLTLADPEYFKSGKIDIILSCEVFFQVILADKIDNGPQKPMALNTKFGWVISGKSTINQQGVSQNSCICIDVDTTLKKFWQLEDISSEPQFTEEEQQIELHFKETHHRNKEGRYVVRLPFSKNQNVLGNSKISAIGTFKAMEKKFEADFKLKQDYSDFMEEYKLLGHMQKIIPNRNAKDFQSYYLPHHAIFKESTTTSTRVVFNASKKTTSGMSLNDILMVGPTIQSDIWGYC